MFGTLFGALADRPVMTAVLGALSIAFSGILVRLADVEPATAAIFRCAYALPALGLIAYLERRSHGPRPAAQVRLAMLAGVFLALDLVIWHHTIGLVGAGLATVLGNTQVVIVAFLAWLILGERPPRRTLLALPIVLVGVVLISGVIGTGARISTVTRPIRVPSRGSQRSSARASSADGGPACCAFGSQGPRVSSLGRARSPSRA